MIDTTQVVIDSMKVIADHSQEIRTYTLSFWASICSILGLFATGYTILQVHTNKRVITDINKTILIDETFASHISKLDDCLDKIYAEQYNVNDITIKAIRGIKPSVAHLMLILSSKDKKFLEDANRRIKKFKELSLRSDHIFIKRCFLKKIQDEDVKLIYSDLNEIISHLKTEQERRRKKK